MERAELEPKPNPDNKPKSDLVEDLKKIAEKSSSNEINIKYRTFEEAHAGKKLLSDELIDGLIKDKIDAKGYLDGVEMTERDQAIADDPERVAKLYLDTTAMLERNLKVLVAPSADPDITKQRRHEVSQAKAEFIDRLRDDSSEAANKIVGWCKGQDRYPVKAMEYYGFRVDGHDILDSEGRGADGVRPNIKIQRRWGEHLLWLIPTNKHATRCVGMKMSYQRESI